MCTTAPLVSVCHDVGIYHAIPWHAVINNRGIVAHLPPLQVWQHGQEKQEKG